MTNFTAQFVGKLAGIATLALAALPALALSTTAHAAPAPATVKVADLDLGSKSGMSAFDRRVQEAGVRMCRDERSLTARTGCEGAVRAEAGEKLAQYLNGRSAPTALAAAR
jgi:UrcA family protein